MREEKQRINKQSKRENDSSDKKHVSFSEIVNPNMEDNSDRPESDSPIKRPKTPSVNEFEMDQAMRYHNLDHLTMSTKTAGNDVSTTQKLWKSKTPPERGCIFQRHPAEIRRMYQSRPNTPKSPKLIIPQQMMPTICRLMTRDGCLPTQRVGVNLTKVVVNQAVIGNELS